MYLLNLIEQSAHLKQMLRLAFPQNKQYTVLMLQMVGTARDLMASRLPLNFQPRADPALGEKDYHWEDCL